MGRPARLDIALPPELFERFKALAEFNDRTLTGEVRRLVREACEAHEAEADAERQLAA